MPSHMDETYQHEQGHRSMQIRPRSMEFGQDEHRIDSPSDDDRLATINNIEELNMLQQYQSEMPVQSTDQYVIYCDMDGVLCDFEKQVEKFCNQPFQMVDRSRMWEVIDRTDEFFFNMDWLPGGKELWAFLRPFKPIMLSSPGLGNRSRTAYIADQKRRWVQNNLGIDRVIVDHDKHRYAARTHILIDDMTKFIRAWHKMGGIAILHTSVENTIRKLKLLLDVDDEPAEMGLC